MNSQTAGESVEIDRKTSRSICDAVGERLQREMPPETSRPSVHLQYLLDELRRRDQDSRLPN
jgi:hypothetical protein